MLEPERDLTEGRPISVHWLLERMPAILSLTGIAIYGITRIGIDSFYGGLDLTPEEAGLGYATIVQKAALNLAWIAVIGSGLVGGLASGPILLLNWRLKRSDPIKSSRERSIRDSVNAPATRLAAGQIIRPGLFAVAVSTVTTIVLALAFIVTDLPSVQLRISEDDSLRTFVVFGLLTLTFVATPIAWLILSILYARRAMKPPSTDPGTYEDSSTEAIVLGLIGIPLFVLFVMSSSFGESAAEQVRDGKPIQSPPFILSGQAQCAIVIDLTGGKPIPDVRDSPALLYLGESKGMLVLYAPGRGPLRVPATRFAVRIFSPDSFGTDCELTQYHP